MDRICNFIVYSIDFPELNRNINEEIYFQTMQNGSEMNMRLDDHYDELNQLIGNIITDVIKYYENEFHQRKTILSFKYNGRLCEISEHYGTQRDYLCVKINNNGRL